MKFSIKYILIFGLMGLLFISVSFTITTTYLSSEKAMLRHAKDIMTNISTFTIEKSQNYLFFARDAARLTSSLADTNVVSRTDPQQMAAYFYKQLAVYSQFSGIYYGDTKGSFIMVNRNSEKEGSEYRTKVIQNSADNRTIDLIWRNGNQEVVSSESPKEDEFDPRKRPWYTKAVKEGKLVWTAPYIFYSSQKPGITTSSPVYNAAGELQGVVGVDIEIDEISDFLSRLTVGKNGLAFILNQNGDVIAFPDKHKITHKSGESGLDIRLIKIDEIDEPITRKAFSSLHQGASNIHFTEPVFTTFEFNNENYHAMFAPFTNKEWSWSIGLYIPENDYLGTFKETRMLNFYILGIVLFIYGVIAFLMGKSIERPLAQLEKDTVSVAAGNSDIKLSINSPYKEIQNMADSFLIMKQNLINKHAELTTANTQLLTEINQKEQTEELLKSSLYEKEVLIKEIHHRVKNNLQVISSLLRLQAVHQLNDDVKDILLKSQSRVHSMALVHENLFQSENLSKVNLNKYLHDLVKHLMVSYQDDNKHIGSDIKCNDLSIPIDIAIPCGLIINEVITNSMKYAFEGKQSGMICVHVENNDSEIRFSISDDGISLQEGDSKQNSGSLGFKLIHSLVEQLSGHLKINAEKKGTEIIFSLPIKWDVSL